MRISLTEAILLKSFNLNLGLYTLHPQVRVHNANQWWVCVFRTMLVIHTHTHICAMPSPPTLLLVTLQTCLSNISSSSQGSSPALCTSHTQVKWRVTMKCAALVASMLLMVQHPDATDGSGSCNGKIVDVFLDSSFLHRGDFWSDPDTYIKVGHLHLLR